MLNACKYENSDSVKVDTYNEIAFYLTENDYEKSNYYSNLAKKLASGINYNSGMARAEYLIGQTYYYRENYKIALEHYFKSLELFETGKKTIDYAYTIVQIGNAYYLITDYANALKYYNNAFKVFDQIDSDEGRSMVFNNLGNLQTINNQFDSAIYNYKLALNIDITTNDVNGMTISYTNIGLLFEKKNQHDSAYNYYKKAIVLCDSINDYQSIVRAYHSLGDYYIAVNQYTDAYKYQTMALNICEQKKLVNLKSEVLYSLSELYEIQGKHKNSLEMLKEYLVIYDSITKAESIKKATLIEFNYELDKKQKKERLKQVQKEYQQKLTWLKRLVLLFLIIFVFVVLFFFQKQKIKRNKLKIKNLLLEYKFLQQEFDKETEEKTILQQQLLINSSDQKGLKNLLNEKNKELVTRILKLVSANEAIQLTIKKLSSQKRYLKGEQLKSINESIAELKRHTNTDIWQRFELSFQEIYSDFYNKLIAEFPFLTSNDLKLCAFIKLNLSTKEIASILNLNPRSVEVARTRLRKKINISNKDLSLHQFLGQY